MIHTDSNTSRRSRRAQNVLSTAALLAVSLLAASPAPASAATNDYTGAWSAEAGYGPDGRTDSAYLPGNHFSDWGATGAVAGAVLPADVDSVMFGTKDPSYIEVVPFNTGGSGATNLVTRGKTPSGRTYIKAFPSQTPTTGLLVFDLLIQGGTWDSASDTLVDELGGQPDFCAHAGTAFWSDNTTMTCFASGNGLGGGTFVYVPYFDNPAVAGSPAITVRVRPMLAPAHHTYTVINQTQPGWFIALPTPQLPCTLCTDGGGIIEVPIGEEPNEEVVRSAAEYSKVARVSTARVSRGGHAKIRYEVKLQNAATAKPATGKVRLIVDGRARATASLRNGASTLAWDPPRTIKPGRKSVVVSYLGDSHTLPTKSRKSTITITR